MRCSRSDRVTGSQRCRGSYVTARGVKHELDHVIDNIHLVQQQQQQNNSHLRCTEHGGRSTLSA